MVKLLLAVLSVSAAIAKVGEISDFKKHVVRRRESDCNRDTGGTCTLFMCDATRGPSLCTGGKCICKIGYCSSAAGVCKAQTKHDPTTQLSFSASQQLSNEEDEELLSVSAAVGKLGEVSDFEKHVLRRLESDDCTQKTGGTCGYFSCSDKRGPTDCTGGECICKIGFCSNADGVCKKECKKDTGGTCAYFGCSDSHGKGLTDCTSGKCNCKSGYCSNADGVCEEQTDDDPTTQFATSNEEFGAPEAFSIGFAAAVVMGVGALALRSKNHVSADDAYINIAGNVEA